MTDIVLSGTLLNEQVTLSLTEICQACSCHREWVVELVSEGVLDPLGARPEDWHFPANSLSTAQAARRLQQDLGINLQGIALVLELLDEVESLRSQLRHKSLFDA